MSMDFCNFNLACILTFKQEVSKNFITQSRLTTTIKNMDNHEHANHRDTAQARIKNKGIRQHKVNDQAQNIDCKQFKILSSKLQLIILISLLI